MRNPTPLLAALLASALLAGCSGPTTSIAANTYPDVPNGYAETINLFSAEPVAVWVHGKTELAVVTVGSVNCAPVPVSITGSGKSTIELTYVKSPNKPCSVDISPTTSEFTVPAGIDPSTTVKVKVHFAYDSPVDYTLEVH